MEEFGVIGTGIINMMNAGLKNKHDPFPTKGDEEGRRYRIYQNYLRDSNYV
jgi:hypothetical protein